MAEWVKAHAWLAVGIALIVGITLGAAAGREAAEEEVASEEGVSVQEDDPDEGFTPEPEEEDAEPEPETVTEDPDATFTKTCTYLLGDGLGDYSLVGTSKVANTGNIGVKVKITFLWNQVGTAPIKKVKEVEVPFGGRKTVQADISASQEQISRLQSMPYNDQCKVRGALVGTFGEPVAD